MVRARTFGRRDGSQEEGGGGGGGCTGHDDGKEAFSIRPEQKLIGDYIDDGQVQARQFERDSGVPALACDFGCSVHQAWLPDRVATKNQAAQVTKIRDKVDAT